MLSEGHASMTFLPQRWSKENTVCRQRVMPARPFFLVFVCVCVLVCAIYIYIYIYLERMHAHEKLKGGMEIHMLAAHIFAIVQRRICRHCDSNVTFAELCDSNPKTYSGLFEQRDSP